MEHGLAKRITLFVVTLAAFLTPFDGSAVNIALPSIGKEFSMDAVSLGWVATAYLLASAMFLVPFGRVADIYGRKKVFTLGILVFTAASFSMVLCGSGAMLICLRIAQGFGSAMIFGTGVALLISIFPPQERGKALGINVAAVYLGLSVGPFLGGLLTSHFGWRSIFLVNVPLGLLAMALVSYKLRDEWAEAKGEKFDLSGSIIYCLGLIAIIYGFSSFSQWGAMVSSGLILLGVLGIFAFIAWEMKVKNPVLNVELFRGNRVFVLSNLAAFIHYGATFAVAFFLSLYLQYIQKLDPQSAGTILVFQPVVMAVCSPFAGRLSDRIEPRIVASMGMALSAAGLFLLAFLQGSTTLEFVIADLILLGLGFALFSSPNTNAVMSSVEKRFYGVASGTLGTMRLTGQVLSMGIAMLIFAVHIGHTQITPEYYPLLLTSTRSAFVLFGILCSGGVFASLARGKVRLGH
ncbi:MAG TPA: MFS transporter [Thermodesulfobacteriota bacterium]|nr:MFS transporter [Thermodesulfobacteriota bacterium]